MYRNKGTSSLTRQGKQNMPRQDVLDRRITYVAVRTDPTDPRNSMLMVFTDQDELNSFLKDMGESDHFTVQTFQVGTVWSHTWTEKVWDCS
jgi:hypothetical protein